MGKFIPADFECPGNPEFGDEAAMASKIKDSRMSFMSGHATFAFQAMTFAVLYLQARVNFAISPWIIS